MQESHARGGGVGILRIDPVVEGAAVRQLQQQRLAALAPDGAGRPGDCARHPWMRAVRHDVRFPLQVLLVLGVAGLRKHGRQLTSSVQRREHALDDLDMRLIRCPRTVSGRMTQAVRPVSLAACDAVAHGVCAAGLQSSSPATTGKELAGPPS